MSNSGPSDRPLQAEVLENFEFKGRRYRIRHHHLVESELMMLLDELATERFQETADTWPSSSETRSQINAMAWYRIALQVKTPQSFVSVAS